MGKKFLALTCRLCGKKAKYTINHIWKHHEKEVWNKPEIVNSPNGILFEVEERYFDAPNLDTLRSKGK